MRIARRLQDLAQSDIRRMTRECERFCFAKDDAVLEEACRRLRARA
jgi:hypothetical protein